jgi:hypothetical protein
MSATMSGSDSVSSLKRIPIAIAISLAGLGLIAVVFATARKPEPPKLNDSAKQGQTRRAHTPWNLALEDVVVFAPDLGLRITAPNKVAIDPARVATRIEAQLLALRQLYRQRSENDPTLLGSFTFQLTVGTSGQVAQVKEISTELKDNEFRKTVLAEAAKWNFTDIAPRGTVIYCPLLFVREGMDITTVLNWEKAVGSQRAKHVPAKKTRRARPAHRK